MLPNADVVAIIVTPDTRSRSGATAAAWHFALSLRGRKYDRL